jgi:hypothetical protein
MATWIVHLRLAENLLDLIDGLDPAYFAIGNVAPDSGVPDKNWENFDPPTEITHFRVGVGAEERSADLVFYRQHLHPCGDFTSKPKQFSFCLGYFFHLITDNLWSDLIGAPTSERWASEFEADPKFIWQVKRDWYGLDFEYVRSNPDCIFWRVFLNSAYKEDYVPFLPKHAIERQLAYIKDLYQREDERIQEWYIERPDLYLSQAEMDAFLKKATAKLHEIYRKVCVRQVDITGFLSVLEFLP